MPKKIWTTEEIECEIDRLETNCRMSSSKNADIRCKERAAFNGRMWVPADMLLQDLKEVSIKNEEAMRNIKELNIRFNKRIHEILRML